MKITTDGKNKIIVVLLSLPYILWLIFGVFLDYQSKMTTSQINLFDLVVCILGGMALFVYVRLDNKKGG